MDDKRKDEEPADTASRLLNEINSKIIELSKTIVENPETHKTRGVGATAMLVVVSEVIMRDAMSWALGTSEAEEVRSTFLHTLEALKTIQQERLIPLRKRYSVKEENVAAE